MSLSRPAFAAISALMFAGSAFADSAEYRLTFTTSWTDPAVPGEHFSGLVGGTHHDGVTFWETGALASLGIERMAELGSKTALINEVETAIDKGTAGAVISGPGAGSPDVVTMTLTVTDEFPLVTVVSMIAPSPDWFVGVSGLSLQHEGAWMTTLEIDLLPYDAGTDSGAFFTSPNLPTVPPEPINLIEDGSLFDPPTLGTYTFELLTDCNDNGMFDVDEIAANPDLDQNGDGILDECQCAADLAGDDLMVGTPDLLVLLANWGTDGAGASLAAPEELVDVADLLTLIASWGDCL